jgi:glycosyltransferase involved in cell wall biosynthesis
VWEVYAHAALTRLTGWTGCFSPFATRNLLRFMDSFAPDVVHIHELHAYFVNITPLMEYLKQKNIKTVWTFHCEFMYTGKCGHSYDCNAWQQECGNCPHVRDYPKSLLFDHTRAMRRRKKRLFDDYNHLTIVSPSEWLASRTRQSFLHDKQITVIPNGIDTDVFKPQDTTSLRSKYDVPKAVVHVTASFEDMRKGGRHILDLARRMPDTPFFIIGNRKPIEYAPANVYAIGRTENQTQLAQWYSFADVTLITSERENFPTVCLESLCCGTPVAGFAGGGTTETAPFGYGEFVPFGDLDALEGSLRKILYKRLPGLRKREDITAFGRERYDKKLMAEKYFEIYCGSNGGGNR